MHNDKHPCHPNLLHSIFCQQTNLNDKDTYHKHMKEHPEHRIFIMRGGQNWLRNLEFSHAWNHPLNQHAAGQKDIKRTNNQAGGPKTRKKFFKRSHRVYKMNVGYSFARKILHALLPFSPRNSLQTEFFLLFYDKVKL